MTHRTGVALDHVAPQEGGDNQRDQSCFKVIASRRVYVSRGFVPRLQRYFLGARQTAAEALPTVQVPIKGHTFTLEVANTEATREHGLMMRDSMAGSHGMLFVFDTPGKYGFWMHDTRIPLDIIFISAEGKVVDITPRRAYDETSVPPREPALYVIELNMGTADKVGLKTGDTIAIPVKALKTLQPGAEK